MPTSSTMSDPSVTYETKLRQVFPETEPVDPSHPYNLRVRIKRRRFDITYYHDVKQYDIVVDVTTKTESHGLFFIEPSVLADIDSVSRYIRDTLHGGLGVDLDYGSVNGLAEVVYNQLRDDRSEEGFRKVMVVVIEVDELQELSEDEDEDEDEESSSSGEEMEEDEEMEEREEEPECDYYAEGYEPPADRYTEQEHLDMVNNYLAHIRKFDGCNDDNENDDGESECEEEEEHKGEEEHMEEEDRDREVRDRVDRIVTKMEHLEYVRGLEKYEPWPSGCKVCLDEFWVGDELVRAPCGHLFHETCMKDWLQEKYKCPRCWTELY